MVPDPGHLVPMRVVPQDNGLLLLISCPSRPCAASLLAFIRWAGGEGRTEGRTERGVRDDVLHLAHAASASRRPDHNPSCVSLSCRGAFSARRE